MLGRVCQEEARAKGRRRIQKKTQAHAIGGAYHVALYASSVQAAEVDAPAPTAAQTVSGGLQRMSVGHEHFV